MRLYSTSASFTRPNNTTQYDEFDLVANDTTAGNVVPMTFPVPTGFLLTAVKLVVTAAATRSITSAQFRLYLYQFLPTVTLGDNGFFQSSESGYLGSVALDCTTTALTIATNVSSDAFAPHVLSTVSPVDPSSIPIFPDNTPTATSPVSNVYGLLQTYGFPGYIPTANEVYTLTLIGMD